MGRDSFLFLPGGGVEESENAECVIVRKILEECGRHAKILKPICEAIQYFEVKSENVNFWCFMNFYLCEFTSSVVQEGEHEFHWHGLSESNYDFYHASHRWALEQSLKYA